ncbi:MULTISPECIES: asparaginase [Lysinibacillus]|uniref:asparaginase n=1 Tax=Lysinibacillus irui TaxID=2998077 RepID=A0AAJ5UV43_9BACI|nr:MULTISPECIES: asparaginase [Lysinibacillus]MEA0563152.1 asparaginase [Lysinibacillus irui]WDV08158.1 asparaginase [Lysinibacillus irui]
MKKTILLIHTGGTISMAMSAEGAVMPNIENPLMKESNKLASLADIIEIEAFNLPSPHITPKEMLQLRHVMMEQIMSQQIDGVVITHGTDTLEETAYFLELTTNLAIPIVLTGAMRSSNELGADGIYNLVEAVRVAVDDEARDKGVLVVMNDEVHLAVNTTKTSTSSVNTFQSPQYGPIGLITKSRILFHHAPIRRQYVEVDNLSKRVAMLKVYAGMEEDLLDVVLACKYDGVVLEGLGQGNVPPSVVKGIESLIQRDIPVILVSRCFNGIAEGVYGYVGGGKMLEDLGAIFATGINGQKARLKLLIGLNTTGSPLNLKDFFL